MNLHLNSLSDNNIGGSVIRDVVEGLQHCSNLEHLKYVISIQKFYTIALQLSCQRPVR